MRETMLIYCACGCRRQLENRDKRGRLRTMFRGHRTLAQREAIRKRMLGHSFGRDRMLEDSNVKMGIVCDCGCNEVRKNGFASNGVRMWQCKRCYNRFREIRTFGRGRKHTIEACKKMMRILPSTDIINDYVNGGMPMVVLAKKYKCRALLIKRCLVNNSIYIRSQKEQKDIDYRSGRLKRPNIGNKYTLGYKHTIESLRIISMKVKERFSKIEERQKMAQLQRELWLDIEHKNRQLRAMMMGQTIKPNKPECCVMGILNELFLHEWEYVGDGAIVINGKNPDFINVNGKKLIIEVFGDYWHKGENPNIRKSIFAKYGYDTMVLWESELKNRDDVVQKLKLFCNRE